MAAEATTSWGAGIPRQCGGVPAGDQVCAAEALPPAVQTVRGTWEGSRGAHISLDSLLLPAAHLKPSQLRKSVPRPWALLLPSYDCLGSR